ncbi:MAG: hypothetical protein K2M37_07105 [Muribaculaceae bacterium]|nr:hypothetical protein [Muribaculaceae bacterium]
MAKFKITPTTTVAELKEQFSNEVGGVLRIYEGRSEAADGATLVSLGAKEGELECRTSRTVGKFEEAFQNDLNLKVKVYTKDNWVKVLDGITLATAAELPNGMTKAKMEEYLSYKKEVKEEDSTCISKIDKQEDEYILFISEKDGVTVKSQDKTEAFLLKEGENKIYLNKYPFLRDGFALDAMESDEITDIDFSHVSNLKVKSLNAMFEGLHLERLDLTHLDTSEVKEVSGAFSYAEIGTIDMSGLDLSKICDPEWCGMFMQNFGIGTIILNGCNAKTVNNIKEALRKDIDNVTIISDLVCSNDNVPSDYEDFTEDMFEEAKSDGNIIVVLKKLNVENVEQLYESVNGGDVCAIITCNDGNFHYVGDYNTEQEEFETEDINFDELYLIYDDVNELEDVNFDDLSDGIYLSESSYSYYSGDEYPMDDNDACFVIAEALTGDDTGHVWGGVDFYPDKIFVCNGKIIARR